MYSNVLFTSAHLTCINTATDFDEVFVIRCAENRHFLYFQYPTFSVIKTNYWMIKKTVRYQNKLLDGIRSRVPPLIGPLLIGPPMHYWSSLVPHLIGPLYHWSPISLAPRFISHPIIGQSQWSPISLVPHLIGSPSHRSPNSSVPHLIGPPISTHASPIPLVSHLIGPPDSLVPHLNGPPISLVPHLIGPPMRPWLHSSHWSPISLVPQCDLGYTVFIGSPSHMSPNATLFSQFPLVPHLIGPRMRPWLHSSHWFVISLIPPVEPRQPSSHWFPRLRVCLGPPLQPFLLCSNCSPISLVS